MIFVSSSCVKSENIVEAVEVLHREGFQNIELSGGTKPSSGLEGDLLALKRRHKLNFLCHNYFPPPHTEFVLNIASLDENVIETSMQHIKRAIDLSKKIDADKYGFHAGFFVQIPVDEIGKRIHKRDLYDRESARLAFINNYYQIIEYSKDIKLYIENNVISKSNYAEFDRTNPLFITDSLGLKEFSELGLNLLLDIGHLKVSCRTLGLNFRNEFHKLSSISDYIHISDNDATEDTNQPVKKGSELYTLLKEIDLSGKTITLEVYSGIEYLRDTYNNIRLLVNE